MEDRENKLRDEILADADRKVERTLKRAEREAEKLIKETDKLLVRQREVRVSEAQKQASETAASIRARIEHDKRRITLEHQERVVEDVFDSALNTIDEMPATQRADVLQCLLDELRKVMGNADIEVRFSERNRQVLEKQARNANTVFTVDDSVKDGLLAQSADGRLYFDNSFDARLARYRPQLRAAIVNILTNRESA